MGWGSHLHQSTSDKVIIFHASFQLPKGIFHSMPVCKSYHKRQTLPWKGCVLAERNFEPSTDTGHKALIKPETPVQNPVLGFQAPGWTVAVTRHIKLGSGRPTSQLDILQGDQLRHYKIFPLPCHSLILDCTLGREERERGIKQILATTAG